MMNNPYERRGRRVGELAQEGWAPAVSLSPPRGLEIDDLQAMAFNASQRGRAQERDELEERHRDQMLNAQREAWEQGRAAGEVSGRARVLANFLRVHGPQLRVRDGELRAVIERMNEDARHVTKQELAEVVARAQLLVTQLLQGAEREFEPEPRAMEA